MAACSAASKIACPETMAREAIALVAWLAAWLVAAPPCAATAPNDRLVLQVLGPVSGAVRPRPS